MGWRGHRSLSESVNDLFGEIDLSWLLNIARDVPGLFGAFRKFMRSVSSDNLVADEGDPLFMDMGGEATAVGQHARTTVDVDGHIEDGAGIDLAFGTVDARAEAKAPRGETAEALTETYYDIDGADFVYSFSRDGGSSRGSRGEARDGSSSELSVIAIDFEDFDLDGGPYVVERQGRSRFRQERFEGVEAEAEAVLSVHGSLGYSYSETDTFTTDDFAVATGFVGGMLG